MALFTGFCRHQLDDKRRFRIPPHFRELLGEKPVMMLSVEKFDTGLTEEDKNGNERKIYKKCIYIYTAEDFLQRVTKRFEQADILNSGMAVIKRSLFPLSQEIEEDSRGRADMPQVFLDRCGIKKDLLTIGAMDHVEIWDEELYNKHLEDIDSDALLARFTD